MENQKSVTFTWEPEGCSVHPIRIDPEVCIGCNRCVQVCQVDILLPNPVAASMEMPSGKMEAEERSPRQISPGGVSDADGQTGRPVCYGPPIVAWPGECYYCGCCVMACPRADQGAITLHHPLMNRAKFVPVKQPDAEKE